MFLLLIEATNKVCVLTSIRFRYATLRIVVGNGLFPGKTRVVSFDQSNMWKKMGLFLMKNDLLRYLCCLSYLNRIVVHTLSLLLSEPWFVPWRFFMWLCFIHLNVPSCPEWNTVVMSRLVLLLARCLYIRISLKVNPLS